MIDIIPTRASFPRAILIYDTHVKHTGSTTPPPVPSMLSATYGGEILLYNDKFKIRLYYIDIHGLSPANNYVEGQHLTDALKLIQVDVWDISGTKPQYEMPPHLT